MRRGLASTGPMIHPLQQGEDARQLHGRFILFVREDIFRQLST
jgi:hypothetical protein